MFILGLSRGPRLLKGVAVVLPFRCFGWCNHTSDCLLRFRLLKELQVTDRVRYGTDRVRCLHDKFCPVPYRDAISVAQI